MHRRSGREGRGVIRCNEVLLVPFQGMKFSQFCIDGIDLIGLVKGKVARAISLEAVSTESGSG